ncbi:amino acid ABC transporter substrate-binding protein [Alicycliphilus denitrificans]|uniref:Amino acid ABC transporter substrate-binding protein n=1 Tax=Alicycliphilus denitrificans TaxID=179636 RepID=A0A858ZS14_9BURK|nr:amino acid ABC transporter substrate-binding protein [Alicycliphilus denitrificans]QKD43577.1 amino acid ABC transporter substrate-binding protein [Alicycliphilus denitrificans]
MKRWGILMRIVTVLLVCSGVGVVAFAGTLEKIAEKKSITLGVRDASVPFSYNDDEGKPIGYTVEICKKVVEGIRTHLRMPSIEIRYQLVTPPTKVPLMANGTIDLECSATSNDPARHNQVAFSNTVFLATNTFIAKRNSGITRIEDLKGKTASSIAATTNLRQLAALNADRQLGIRILTARDLAEAFLMLETDRTAALVLDDAILINMVASSRNPQDYVFSSERLAPPEPYAIMLRKDDPEFKKVVDATVAEYLKSSDGMANYQKWFESAIPPRGYNLKFPMPPGLKKAYSNPTDSVAPGAYD